MEIHYFDGNKMMKNCEDDREVFHYTSPDSFLSILKHGKFWFGDSQFMNDRSEYVYIKEIFKQAAKGTTHDIKDSETEDENSFIDYILGFPYGGIAAKPLPKGKKGFSHGLVLTRYYMLCASLNSDSHSLWNYYVKNNHYQGYNIGINVNALIDCLTHSTWNITHGFVNYDKKTQVRNLHRKIVELSKEYDNSIQAGMDEDYCIELYQEQLAEYLIQRCLFYKNPAFAHEEEYRFIIEAPITTQSLEKSCSIVDFHVGGGGLIIPHLDVDFKPIDVINRITLAPMMEREIAKQGIQRLLESKFEKSKIKIPINYSQIDVRY